MYAFGWYTKDRVHIIFLRRFRTRRLHASFAHTAQTLPKRKKMFSHVELHKHDQQFYAISSGPQGSQEWCLCLFANSRISVKTDGMKIMAGVRRRPSTASVVILRKMQPKYTYWQQIWERGWSQIQPSVLRRDWRLSRDFPETFQRLSGENPRKARDSSQNARRNLGATAAATGPCTRNKVLVHACMIAVIYVTYLLWPY